MVWRTLDAAPSSHHPLSPESHLFLTPITRRTLLLIFGPADPERPFQALEWESCRPAGIYDGSMAKRDSQDQDQRLPVNSLNFSHPCKSRLWEIYHPLFCCLAGYRSSGAIFHCRGNHRYETHPQMCGRRRKVSKRRKDARAGTKHAFTQHSATTTLAAAKCHCG